MQLREEHLYKKINNLITYYIIKLLKKDDKFLITTKQGNFGEDAKEKIYEYNKKEDAIKEFNEKFEKKTGNKYGETFVKKIDKYSIEYPNDDDVVKILDPEIQYLLNIISDEIIISTTLDKIGINPKMMPIEKINKLRIAKAEEILHKINNMQDNEISMNIAKIKEYEEEYNRYIPYKKTAELNNKNDVATHIANIETIKNIYETYSNIIKNKKKGGLINKEEYVLEALGVEINLFKEDNPKYTQVVECIKSDKNNYKIAKIYEIVNKKQNDIFDATIKEKSNITKKLLFHGSPVTNWFSIIKNGFYINPTQVGVKINGKAYGNGVYFSDSLRFSHGYCNTNKYDKNNISILGLCEVGLCEKSVDKSPIFVIFDTKQYVLRYLIIVDDNIKFQ
jgi:hypothetical protein